MDIYVFVLSDYAHWSNKTFARLGLRDCSRRCCAKKAHERDLVFVRARSGSPGGRPANGIQVSGVVGCCDERRLQVLVPDPRSPVAAAGKVFGVEGAPRKAVHRPMMPCTDAMGAYTKSHTLLLQVARSLDGIIYRPKVTYLMTEIVVTVHGAAVCLF